MLIIAVSDVITVSMKPDEIFGVDYTDPKACVRAIARVHSEMFFLAGIREVLVIENDTVIAHHMRRNLL